MTFTKVFLALACLISGTLVAQEAKVTQLLSKDLTNLPGKEGLMVTVEHPPGSSDPIHRHNAHGFIYVLEGSIVMQVRGGKETTVLVRPSTKARMMSTLLGGTQAKPNRRNSSCSS
jgi:hypothetical protein